jgi:tetratricopeptide (TPR) repeat protein
MKEIIAENLTLLSGRTKPVAEGYHIFYRLLRSLDKELDFEQRLTLEWVFSTTEKSLSQARRGNRYLSEQLLKEVEAHSEKGSELVRHAQNFVILPARAFHEYYCLQRYDLAIQYLQEAIASVNAIAGKGRPKMLGAAVEQYMNICRVVYKQDAKKSLLEFGSLLSFLFGGDAQLGYASFGEANALQWLGRRERDQLVDHFTEVALEKFRVYRLSSSGLSLRELFAPLLSVNYEEGEELLSLYRLAVDFITADPGGIPRELSARIVHLMPELYILPKMLQYYFFEQLKTVQAGVFEEEPKLVDIIHDYCLDKLGLQHIFTSETYQVDIAISPLRQIKKEDPELMTA